MTQRRLFLFGALLVTGFFDNLIAQEYLVCARNGSEVCFPNHPNELQGAVEVAEGFLIDSRHLLTVHHVTQFEKGREKHTYNEFTVSVKLKEDIIAQESNKLAHSHKFSGGKPITGKILYEDANRDFAVLKLSEGMGNESEYFPAYDDSNCQEKQARSSQWSSIDGPLIHVGEKQILPSDSGQRYPGTGEISGMIVARNSAPQQMNDAGTWEIGLKSISCIIESVLNNSSQGNEVVATKAIFGDWHFRNHTRKAALRQASFYSEYKNYEFQVGSAYKPIVNMYHSDLKRTGDTSMNGIQAFLGIAPKYITSYIFFNADGFIDYYFPLKRTDGSITQTYNLVALGISIKSYFVWRPLVQGAFRFFPFIGFAAAGYYASSKYASASGSTSTGLNNNLSRWATAFIYQAGILMQWASWGFFAQIDVPTENFISTSLLSGTAITTGITFRFGNK